MKPNLQIAIACVLVASLIGAGGQFLFKLAANRGGTRPLGFLLTPWAAAGLASYFVIMVLYSHAFQRGGTVPLLYPIYATTFIWAAVMAWALYGQPIRPIHALGMVLLITGIVLMSWGQKATP